MPAAGVMYDTNEIKPLRRSRRPRGASRATQRHAGFALAAFCGLLALAGGCATVPKQPASDTIDVRDDQGRDGSLSGLRGRVVVIDLCASWAAACNVNAKILDEAEGAFRGQPVEFITVLIDDDPAVARQALRAYRDVLGVKHAVFLAGAHVRAGTSALGDASYVPRLVILDENGAIRVDDSGGVLNVQGLVSRVRPLLKQR